MLLLKRNKRSWVIFFFNLVRSQVNIKLESIDEAQSEGDRECFRLDTLVRCDYFVRKVADSEVRWQMLEE